MSRSEAVSFLKSHDQLKGAQLYNVEADSHEIVFMAVKGNKAYYGIWNEIDGIDLEYAGKASDFQ